MAIAQLSWIICRRPFVRSVWGGERIPLCLLGTLHHLSVPGHGVITRRPFSDRPVVTARVAETKCQSQATSSKTVAADRKLRQRTVIHLPTIGEEKLKSIFSAGSARQPRASTPVVLRVLVRGHPRPRVWRWNPLPLRQPLRALVLTW